MLIEQIYTGCLAQGAYYIESGGEAAVIDPLRDTAPYLERAKRDGAKIKYIFETHFHADFVSGHVELAEKTGAEIVFGPGAVTDYEIHQGVDGELLKLGELQFKLLHTPGHTMESAVFLLLDNQGKEVALFTGDTLFLGDVGRPDLAVKSNLSQEELAGKLFDSLREKIMPLPDHVIVYPGHGAGSACGKKLSNESSDTLGRQKEGNYALRANMTREQFIQEVTAGLLPPPAYFAGNVMLNKHGPQGLDAVLKAGNTPLEAEVFEALANQERALVLDTRPRLDFIQEHIPRSIFIGLDGTFAPWAGALIGDLRQPILVVCEDGKIEDVLTRLSRVGYDNTLGFLKGGLDAWKASGKATDSLDSISAQEFAERYEAGASGILDVRKPGEFSELRLSRAQSFPLDYISEGMAKIEPEQEYYLHCAGGYRSVIAASILKSRGFHHLVNVAGGFDALKSCGLPDAEFRSD